MKSIIFVCLGNICRSPIAEGCAKKYAKEHGVELKIDSAGTGSWHVGEAPCENSIIVARDNGIDISGLIARQITNEDINNFDLIVALDDSNYKDLKAMRAENLVKLGDYGYNGEDVPDPYFFKGFDGFAEVYKMIDTCTKNLLQEIK